MYIVGQDCAFRHQVQCEHELVRRVRYPTLWLLDLQSVATHELGHSLGFVDHFASTDSACDTSPTNTMCSGTGPGQTFKRTLESHDIHTTYAAYD